MACSSFSSIALTSSLAQNGTALCAKDFPFSRIISRFDSATATKSAQIYFGLKESGFLLFGVEKLEL
ncbi:hypothetical protein [Pseudomonas juntendi]|uniref:hypothetical protein n=1 Tax=Pseudomonas juntendi TaxID=2666183 RepID=UPI00294A23F4|nr:hypothetical protein [Pseudomonas juntendi]MDV5388602.1 hypothetical protein [Pseudomonas juntendi]